MKLSDIGAERAVLAGLANYGLEAYVDLMDIITSSTFTDPNNQVIYECLAKIATEDGVTDIPSVVSAAESLGVEEVVTTQNNLDYILDLINYAVDKRNILRFAMQIKKFEFARNSKKVTKSIEKNIDSMTGEESFDEIVGMIETPLINFLREDEHGEKPQMIGEGVDEYLEFVVENKCDQLGLSTGFANYDAVLGGGLRRACVDVISARPGVGKSVISDNIAIHNTKSGIPVLMVDTEMKVDDHYNRVLAHMSGVPQDEIATGRFAEDEEKYNAVKRSAKQLKEMPYTYECAAGKPWESILNTIKRWILQEVGTDEDGRTNDCLVIVDYLKLMSAGGIVDIKEFQALGFQIQELHNLSVKYDISCVCLTQLNRDGITQETTASVSGSDRIIWFCTSFSMLKEKSPDELAEDGPRGGNRKLVTLKARHGPRTLNGNYINFRFEGEYARLTELHTRDQGLVNPEGGIEGSEITLFEDEDEN